MIEVVAFAMPLDGIPTWGWATGAVGLWFLSLGVRSRDRLDVDDTQRTFKAMGRPARKDVRRAGGIFSGLLMLFWAISQELVLVSGDLFGLGSDVLTTYPDFLGYVSTTVLGYAGLSGRVSLDPTQYLGLALVIAALILMTKN